VSLVPFFLILLGGFVYISQYPGQSLMGVGMGSIVLSAFISFALGTLMTIDMMNPLWGFLGGLTTFFITFKVLVGLP
jgi:hypothetical protein